MNATDTNATETLYNVWELGPWSQIVDCRPDKSDADYLATRFTREGRFTHVVTRDGDAFDKQLLVNWAKLRPILR